MCRPAHPADPRDTHLILRAAAVPVGATLALLALTMATGALRSPLLLLLPVALLHTATKLDRRRTLALLLAAGAALLAAEALRETIGWLELAALAAALGVLAWRSAPQPSTRTPRSDADVTPPHLPERPREQTARDALVELQRQVGHVRAWSAAAAVVLWEAREGRARPLAAAGRVPPAAQRAEGDPLLWVAREGTPAWLEPTPYWSEPRWSVAAARVWADEDVAWIVTWEYPEATERPTHDALAAWCGPLRVLLDVLSVQRRAAAGEERLERLLAVLRRIPVEIQLQRFGEELLHAAMSLTGATGGVLGTWQDETGEVVAVTGHEGGPAVGSAFLPRTSELGLAILAGAPLLREAGQWRPGVSPLASAEDEWLGRPRTLAAMPLATPARTVGAMALWSSRADRFREESLELLRAVLPYAALHLEHAREYGQLQEDADRDPLTGLRNRRGFEAAFEQEQTRFGRYGHPLSLLMIDIDHFKSINDQYGHEAGDEVLRTLAGVIARTVRDVDVPARFGGEEFIVLLPETPLSAASEAGERLRAAVERAVFRAGGRELPVRISVGVSSCPERAATPIELTGSADGALYEAKRGGRNRVETA